MRLAYYLLGKEICIVVNGIGHKQIAEATEIKDKLIIGRCFSGNLF